MAKSIGGMVVAKRFMAFTANEDIRIKMKNGTASRIIKSFPQRWSNFTPPWHEAYSMRLMNHYHEVYCNSNNDGECTGILLEDMKRLPR